MKVKQLLVASAALISMTTTVLADEIMFKDLRIGDPFARATLPNQPVAGGFMMITNTGETDETLVAARSPAAARMEVHEMAMDGDVMRMREVEGGLKIPAGQTVSLEPGGYHIMFMDLAGPLIEGSETEVTLTFTKAGEITFAMPVVSRGNGGMAHGGHGGS
ncbi:MAG: copper chaperone PCu(A)C [Boseongicola sp.]|nr:copper chaperone PCu(A)C [Boseongicola sp.]